MTTANRPVPDPDAPTPTDELMQLCQAAANAAMGDSNDTEIEALQMALEAALSMLNLQMPEPEEED